MKQNCLHVVCGSPGSGKTTFGKSLAQKQRAVFLDIDTSTEPVVQAAMQLVGLPQDDRDSSIFKETFREPIYECLFNIALENIDHIDVVIAGPFTKELRQSDWKQELERKFGGCDGNSAQILIYYLLCDDETRKQRLIARANPRDKQKLERWDEHCGYYSASLRPACDHVLVNTSS